MLNRILPVGPRSVLYGAHCFFIHPFFVAWGWYRLYGFPWDPRLWFAFFLHDCGYLFQWCRNMDGPEGEAHVEFGAKVMGALFGAEWYDFCLLHSRFYAKNKGKNFSRLCVADKYSTVLIPPWLYLPLVRLSGEIVEYKEMARTGKYACENRASESDEEWFLSLQLWLNNWVCENV